MVPLVHEATSEGTVNLRITVVYFIQQVIPVERFLCDSMTGNRRFRTFNVIDDCCRDVLAIEVDTSISSKRLIRILDRVIDINGMPEVIRVDNGPEFTSKDFELWAKEKGIHIQYIQPGRPMQNGYIERFNRLYREAVLDAYLFLIFTRYGN